MKSQGSLNLEGSRVPVEVANMPITMLSVPPSEISLEVIKLLEKQKKIGSLWNYVSLFISLIVTFVTADKFRDFLFSGTIWQACFGIAAAFFFYKIMVTWWHLKKNGFDVNAEEVADNLLKKARGSKTVMTIKTDDSIRFPS